MRRKPLIISNTWWWSYLDCETWRDILILVHPALVLHPSCVPEKNEQA